jgi:ICE2
VSAQRTPILGSSAPSLQAHCFVPLAQFLALYYFFTSTLHLIVRNTRLVFLSRLLFSIQFLVVPCLLFVALNVWSSPTAHAKVTNAADWIHWTCLRFPAWWGAILRISSPFFVILEGMHVFICVSSLRVVLPRRSVSLTRLLHAQIYAARDPVDRADSPILYRRTRRIIRFPLPSRLIDDICCQRLFAARRVALYRSGNGQRDAHRRVDHQRRVPQRYWIRDQEGERRRSESHGQCAQRSMPE